MSANASGATISVTSLNGGPAADLSISGSATDTASTGYFASPSFSVATTNMSGGGATEGSLLYSFIIPEQGGYDGNGNLLSVTDSVMGQWNYSYDNLNRVAGATAPTSQPAGVNANFAGVQAAWSYDPFGNRSSEAWTGNNEAPVPGSTSATYNSNNQIGWTNVNVAGSNVQYDAAGNMLYDGRNSYLYDAEGRICAVQEMVNGTTFQTGYVYDASGIRVAKGSLASFSCNFAPSNFMATTSWVLGPGGEQVTEYAVSGGASTWVHTNAFASGALLATYNGTDTYFALNDWLGTKRAEVSAGGCFSSFTGLPFGNGLTANGNCADATEHHFTQKERDTETGNDYFMARYYSSALGRFTTPDWSAKIVPVPYAQMGDPQSLNLYAYVRNNPVIGIDTDGHITEAERLYAIFLQAQREKQAQQRTQQNYGSVVIKNGQSHETHLCGNGECVTYVKEAGGFNTPTAQWKAGDKVLDLKDKGLQSGTVIMLADKDGHYPSGSSPKHAAEFVGFTKGGGIEVRDQWAARYDKNGNQTRPDQPVHTRILNDNGGKGNPIGDASRYYVVLIPVKQ